MRALVLAAALATALAGCAREPAAIGGGSVATATATVESVDVTSRRVRLRDNAGGGAFTVTAGPDVANLAALEPGDVVEVDVFEATLVDLADPSDPGAPQVDVVTGRPVVGPGGAALVATSFVVEVVGYDAATGVATFVTPDGVTRTAAVRPAVRDLAAARRPGDRVLVTLLEGVAIRIAERPA